MKTEEQKTEELTLKLRRAYERFMATGRKLKVSDRKDIVDGLYGQVTLGKEASL